MTNKKQKVASITYASILIEIGKYPMEALEVISECTGQNIQEKIVEIMLGPTLLAKDMSEATALTLIAKAEEKGFVIYTIPTNELGTLVIAPVKSYSPKQKSGWLEPDGGGSAFPFRDDQVIGPKATTYKKGSLLLFNLSEGE